MDELELLARAGAAFRDRLTAVRPDQWALPTPCTDWSVRELVEHVVVGNRMSDLMLKGNDARSSITAAQAEPREDLLAAFDDGTARQQAGFAAPGALDRTIHHVVGDIPGRVFLGFRLGDLALHAWDLARATGGDEELDPDLVAAVWAGMAPIGPMLATSGRFGTGPSGSVPEDAPLQQRLLDLAGRRP